MGCNKDLRAEPRQTRLASSTRRIRFFINEHGPALDQAGVEQKHEDPQAEDGHGGQLDVIEDDRCEPHLKEQGAPAAQGKDVVRLCQQFPVPDLFVEHHGLKDKLPSRVPNDVHLLHLLHLLLDLGDVLLNRHQELRLFARALAFRVHPKMGDDALHAAFLRFLLLTSPSAYPPKPSTGLAPHRLPPSSLAPPGCAGDTRSAVEGAAGSLEMSDRLSATVDLRTIVARHGREAYTGSS
mmetsp:Transcript_87035/g.244061  ORF Transcript_87035/g.244061 Transcript_87035/m.244061 type:complete len:238 (-) Transcript_87035:918-1631(-)